MKNIETKWTKEEVEAMRMRRGPVRGVAAVLVSEKLGSEYSSVVPSCSDKTDDAVENIVAGIPPTIGVYAALPTSDPEWLAGQSNYPWNDEVLCVAPYTVVEDGIVFHKTTPDNALGTLRCYAWDKMAEENHIHIVERWGIKVTA